MAEGIVDTILWEVDDDSWAFPILTADQENDGNGLKEKEAVEAEPGKGKKRRAATAEAAGDIGEQHILIERERRKKMRDLFTTLHSLIPHLPPRTDKATIVDEAVEYIQKLENTLQSLNKQKAQILLGGKTSCVIPAATSSIRSREVFVADQHINSVAASANPNRAPLPTAFKTWTSPNVILNVFGRDAHINVCCPKRPALLTGICFVLEKHVLEVVSAEVSSDGGGWTCMIHARANGGVVELGGSDFMVEEIFKQAASEIMVFIQNHCFNTSITMNI